MIAPALPRSESPLGHALASAVASEETRHAFALVDGAILRDLPVRARQRWPASKARSLLTGATGTGAAEAGPLLFPLSKQEVQDGLPDTLLDATTGRHAGSFLLSALDLNALAARLSPFVDVKMADDSTMVMRFFDPRVLPFWLVLAQAAFSRHLAGTLSRWFYWDAQLALKAVPFTAPGGAAADAGFPLRITSAQEQQLLEACHPYTLIERFRVEDPAALAKVPVTERYAFFQTQIERARGHGIEATGELEAYCSLAIDLGPLFDEHEVMRTPWRDVKAGAKLADALASVGNADWSRVRGTQ